MASYKKDPKTHKWYVRYKIRDSMGNVVNKRKRGFETKGEAVNYYERNIAPKLREPDGVSVNFETVYPSFLTYKRNTLKESSYVDLQDVCGRFIVPYFAHKRLDKITSLDLIKWQDGLNEAVYTKNKKDGTQSAPKKYSYGYKCKIRTYLYSFFEFAVDHYGLKQNPFGRVKGFSDHSKKKEMLFWTPEEFERFMSVIDEPTYFYFFAFHFLMGCRPGETRAVKWEDIDFAGNVVHIDETYSRKLIDHTNQTYKLTSPKTETSDRYIDMPDVLARLLCDYYNECCKIEGFQKNWFVFGGIRPLPETSVTRKKNLYCQLAEVKQIRMQDFRHSQASLLINSVENSEQNILLIAQRLGHKDKKMTLNTYAHLFKSKQAALVKGLNISLQPPKSRHEAQFGGQSGATETPTLDIVAKKPKNA